MTNEVKIEAKLGFDKLRGSVAARCSTGYGRERAEGEMVSIEPAEIERRLGLADEMRVILMFETAFAQSLLTYRPAFADSAARLFGCPAQDSGIFQRL